MNQRTLALVESLDVRALDTLEVSGGKNSRWRDLPFRSYRSADFPDFDICSLPLQREAFDLIIAEQVFEHVVNPWRAAMNTFDMLRPGGRVLVTTPFLISIHNEPTDCTRWTPMGLASLLASVGFDRESMHVDSWGNRKCVVANFNHWRVYWPGVHSLANEPAFPVVVWAFAQRPAADDRRSK